MAYIDIENLTFGYKSETVQNSPVQNEKVQNNLALENINIQVEGGDFLILSGASGSGKTTLLRLINKLIAPYGDISGSIKIAGENAYDMDKREIVAHIGFVSQNPDNQIICEKPYAEMAYTLENLNFDNNTIRRRIAEMSNYFGIQNYFDKNTNELSGGQKQILNLAAAMCTYPKLLLLDEPLAMLDPIYSEEFIGMLGKLNKEMGITIILCEHDLNVVYPLATKLCILDNGKVEFFGEAKEGMSYIIRNEKTVEVPQATYILNKYCNSNEIVTIRDGRRILSNLPENKKLEISKNESRYREEKQNECAKNETAFSLKKVFFKYSKYEPFILENINFSGNKGDIITLVGGNGAGKSTLLSIISGYNKPLSGKVVGEKVGYLPQNPSLIFSEDSVGAELKNLVPNERTKMIMENLPSIKRILDNEKINPMDLSGGQKQLLAFYKMAAANVDVLLLDEPVKALDYIARKELEVLMKLLANAGTCIVMVTHNLDFAAKVSNKIAMIFEGDIISVDAPNEFFLSNHFYTTNLRKLGQGIIKKLY